MSDARSNNAFNGAQQLLEPGMIDQMRLSWRLMRDPRVSWIKNAIPVIAALYVISPVDLAPDFLPGIGQIDDVGLLVALMLVMIRLLPKLAPADVVAEHLDDIRGTVRPQGREAGTAGEQVVEGRFRVRD